MKVLLLFLLLFFTTILSAQENPKPATDVLKEAYTVAAKEGKKVFLIFHASWCGWCHKMDSSMNDKAVKKFFDDNYIIRHLTVFEAEGKKAFENPGALELLTKYNGNNDGIPFWLIFDSNGTLLADSKARPEGAELGTPGANTGCPASKEEVAHFIAVLKKTSRLKEGDLALIAKRFSEN
jgi:thiol-disulfide isomerase/thioredoxin